ncbi:MAG: LD-carboxypeptidase [Prevotellaceae bacterium]|jgi:muramoyltetrapeptide carboxypeptidase|nr:LD-carboxypeptidase [Prevotellaceae bacterium]
MQKIVDNRAIIPPYLQKGDTIGIVAPAKQIEREYVDNAIKVFQNWGLEVVLGEHIFDGYNQFAGTDEHRAADLQGFFTNSEVKAIICTRGGYGSIRTFGFLDFQLIRQNPKWLIGYSDITAYHTLFNSKLGVATIHGAMPLNFPDNAGTNESVETLRKALFGKLEGYTLSPNSLNIHGTVKGTLIGGNLSILQSVAATPADIIPDNAILFIEEIDEYLYHIDRMMMNLKYSSKLAKLKAIITGGMTGIKDNNIPFGKTANELIQGYAVEAGIPAVFDFPAGHQEPNLALYFGRTVTLDIGNTETRLLFE